MFGSNRLKHHLSLLYFQRPVYIVSNNKNSYICFSCNKKIIMLWLSIRANTVTRLCMFAHRLLHRGNELRFTSRSFRVNFLNRIVISMKKVRNWKKKNPSTGGVRTHADIRPLELKSNALTTRPPYLI